MKIDEFKRLEQKIDGNDFNRDYKGINTVMFVLSIFGHITSIFLAYFALSKLFTGIIENQVLIAISSIILLSGLELLKRDIFSKFGITYLKTKAFIKNVIGLSLLSILLISISLFATINGAKEFSSKEKNIIETEKEFVSIYKDSITNLYNTKIGDKELEIKLTKDKINEKDKEQTNIESVQPLTHASRNRINDLKNEKSILRKDISKIEEDITNLKVELTDNIKKHSEEISSETEGLIKDNSSKSLAFILISTLIEIMIIAGVYFNTYFRYRTYTDFRNKLEKDPNYQKYLLYEQILNVMYSEDMKMNQKLGSNKSIIDVCKINDIIVLPKDITDFMKIMNNLGVIKSSGSAKYINKQRDLSFETLRKHFNIK
jgi:hypothetical protein